MSRITRFWHRPVETSIPDDGYVWFDVPDNNIPQRISYADLYANLKTALTVGMTPGAGTAGVGTVIKSGVEKVGDLFRTTIFIDLTGLQSSTTDLDIIGTGLLPAYFAQITAAVNGTIFAGKVTCLETPATGADDIDFYAATEGTGVFDGGIAALAETALLTSGAPWAAAVATPIALSALPAANKYLYMTCGEGGTVGTYTAGQFLIELWGL